MAEDLSMSYIGCTGGTGSYTISCSSMGENITACSSFLVPSSPLFTMGNKSYDLKKLLSMPNNELEDLRELLRVMFPNIQLDITMTSAIATYNLITNIILERKIDGFFSRKQQK